MAIDRTLKWRCQWQGKNGWANMLEIIPAGAYLDATDLTVTSFSRSAFEMDFAEFGFEDLPIGVGKFPAASFSFVWNNLPSGLKELLREPYYATTETTTLFTYYNDEGTSTLILQYIGAQANTLGNSFDMSSTSTVQTCKIETFDLLKTIFDTVKITDSYLFLQPETYSTEITQYQVDSQIADFSDDTDWKVDSMPFVDNARIIPNFILYSIADFQLALGQTLVEYLALWTRSGVGTYLPTVPQTGYLDTSLTLYKQTQTDAHTKGAALDETNTLICGFVATGNGTIGYTPIGGIFSDDKDGAGAMFDSLGAFIEKLTENFVCKFQAKPITQVNGVSGKTLLTYDLYWLKPFENIVSPVTLSPKITSDNYTIQTAEKVFLTAECEIPNMSGDNINQSRVTIAVTDKTDVWSTQCIVHNLPTIRNVTGTDEQAQYGDRRNKYTAKITPNKLLYRDASLDYHTLKVHESVVINDGINTHTLDSPTAFGTDNWYDSVLDGWVIATQQTQGLPQAIAEYITTYWSSRDQALRDFPCKMVTAEIMPSQISDWFTLPAITDIVVGQYSCLLSGKPDWDNGVMDCKFLSIPD